MKNEKSLHMNFFVAGLNHKTACVEVREQLAVNSSDLARSASYLKKCEDLDEIVLLSTCNRIEIYAATSHPIDRSRSILQWLCAERRDFRAHTYFYEDIEATRHLFRVASGLDSMVLGETEITGQVKKAYEIARGAQLTAGTLNRIFQKAFQVVKEIRTQTGIGRGASSVGGAAVELAGKIFPYDLSRQSVMIIGAGQMAEACIRHLVKKGARSILVCNRSFDRAVALAGEFGGRPVRFEDYFAAMADADIVVASTAWPKTLLQREDVERVMVTRRNRPLILIDISVPRNIDAEANRINNVYVYNIDDLNAIVSDNVRNRERDLPLCDEIIENQASAVMEKLSSLERSEAMKRKEPFQSVWARHSTAVGASYI